MYLTFFLFIFIYLKGIPILNSLLPSHFDYWNIFKDQLYVNLKRNLLLHEVMHLRVDLFNDRHQIVKNVFCVVHRGVHEVPVKGGQNK